MENCEYFGRRLIRKFKRTLGLLLLAIVITLILGGYIHHKFNQVAASSSEPVNFVIAKGENTKDIAHKLSDNDLINSPWVFLLYAKLHDTGAKVQAGTYNLDTQMSIAQIIDVITTGRVVPADRKVTIIEGLSNQQLAANLEKRNIVTAAEFNSALASDDFDFTYSDLAHEFQYQGFLFPDTYQIPVTASAVDLIQKMLTNFENKLTPELQTQMSQQNRHLKDVLILASIIEKEVGRNKKVITAADQVAMQNERRLVASVFYNRMAIGMRLESDATVNYVTGKSDRSATLVDIKIQSPYNTYVTAGLPPTPIANPGLGSIEAAINPATSDYLYFLNDPEGQAYFGKTLAEHNQNRQKYLR